MDTSGIHYLELTVLEATYDDSTNEIILRVNDRVVRQTREEKFESLVNKLVDKGFERTSAQRALKESNMDLDKAITNMEIEKAVNKFKKSRAVGPERVRLGKLRQEERLAEEAWLRNFPPSQRVYVTFSHRVEQNDSDEQKAENLVSGPMD